MAFVMSVRCLFRSAAAMLLGVILLACAYLYGVVSHRFELFPYHYAKKLIETVAPDRLAQYGGYDPVFDRTRVPCDTISRNSLVLITFGQSNAANSGTGRFDAIPGVYNFNFLDGQCYAARDPLLGAGGSGGSAWMPLAKLLIEHGLVTRVIIAPIAMGQTRVADWAPGGSMSGRIDRVAKGLADAGLRAHALLWHQGESDRVTRPEVYSATFLRMAAAVRNLGLTAPIYVARATYCDDRTSGAINAAQAELGAKQPGLRPGPDTDTLLAPALRNGCHFTRQGLLEHAALWFDALATDIPGLMQGSTDKR